MYGLDTFERIAIWSVLGIAILGLLYAVFLRYQVLKEDKGTPKMQEVWNAIREGANAYLQRQLVTILPLIAILTIALFLSIYIVPPSPEASNWYCGTIKGVPLELTEQCAETLTQAEKQQV
ncbi:MAG: sodium/proton-translocating pyrophosphatase, partial [Anaerolineales bacterium]